MMIWDDRHIARLTAMWPTYTASQIGEAFGCGKNAVIGKAHRLRLPSKIKPSKLAAASAMIIRLYRAGRKLTDIASAVGLPLGSVNWVIYGSGVKCERRKEARAE